MSKMDDLKKGGYKELDAASKQLIGSLSTLDVMDTSQTVMLEVANARGKLETYFNDEEQKLKGQFAPMTDPNKLARWFELVQNVSHSLGLLRVVAGQRKDPRRAGKLREIDQLVQDCYAPVFDGVFNGQTTGGRLQILPTEILAVPFQSQYLARPQRPVPYLIVPNYDESGACWGWIGVAHEVGHHIYRQVKGLRDEIEILVVETLISNNCGKEQQRLWFNYAGEVFADLYGILTMGAAFVIAQQNILLYAGSARRFWTPLKQRPNLNRYLKGLLVGQDVTHPISLIRGCMGVYIYERLLLGSNHRSPYLAQLKKWDEICQKLVNESLHDPHTPRNKNIFEDKFNLDGELDQAETIEAMKLVVGTLLDTRLRTLKCHKLSSLVKFAEDEELREETKQALESDDPPPAAAKKHHQVAAKQLRARARRQAAEQLKPGHGARPRNS